MEEFVLKHRKEILTGLAGLLILALLVSLMAILLLPKSTGAQQNVTITATVQSWATISANPTSPSMDNYLVTSTGAVYIGTATSTLTMGTNHTDGLTVTIIGGKGGSNPSQLERIGGGGSPIVSATATLSAGTDGYGAQCTAISGTICNANYNLSGNNVRVIPGNGQSAATFLTAETGTGKTATLVVKAASVSTRVAGDYTDTITLTATPGT